MSFLKQEITIVSRTSVFGRHPQNPSRVVRVSCVYSKREQEELNKAFLQLWRGKRLKKARLSIQLLTLLTAQRISQAPKKSYFRLVPLGTLKKISKTEVEKDGERGKESFFTLFKDDIEQPLQSVVFPVGSRRMKESRQSCLLSLLVSVKGGGHASTLLVLWVLYQSVFSVGQAWYAFAWEILLLEIGFLSIFISPFWCCSRLPETWPTPLVAVWGCRWLLFRLLVGSGLTKLRSKSNVWRDFSAFDFLYATQPLPNPLSWYFHHETHTLHAVAAVAVLVVECVAGFMLLLPVRSCRLLAACAHLLLQIWWALGGNYAFLTCCSCLPAILCLDDRFLSCLFPMETLGRVQTLVSLSPAGFSCPLTQAWPLHPRKRHVQSEAQRRQGAQEGKGADTLLPQPNGNERADEVSGLIPKNEDAGDERLQSEK
ncbi:UNVERIFIED_CONTAM: hypothetical protein H355_005472 [Colinus virginianus]|nr:hypothetical protein H355_005472 [Colinus virginianus]